MEILSEKEVAELVQKADECGVAKYIDLEEKDKEEAYLLKLKQMDTPIDAQKHILAKLNIFLDEQIETEMRTMGKLSNATRIWIKDNVEMLDKLEHNIHGTKSLNLNIGTEAVSHGQIAQKLRKLPITKKNGK